MVSRQTQLKVIESDWKKRELPTLLPLTKTLSIQPHGATQRTDQNTGDQINLTRGAGQPAAWVTCDPGPQYLLR